MKIGKTTIDEIRDIKCPLCKSEVEIQSVDISPEYTKEISHYRKGVPIMNVSNLTKMKLQCPNHCFTNMQVEVEDLSIKF